MFIGLTQLFRQIGIWRSQCLPLWGRWIAEGETDEGGTMFYVHKHFGEMGNPHPTSLTLGHLPQRGRLFPAKFQFS